MIAAKRADAKLIVVLQIANAKAIGAWADQADAIVLTYMPGQEGGRALAKVLTGEVNPSGKLTQTFPRYPSDTPLTDTEAHIAERLTGTREDGETVIRMSEGIFTGYRWYDLENVEPLFPFGHGLSYTTFAYSDLTVENGAASFTVTNTGDRTGDEIAEVYIGKATVPAHIQMPEKQLMGYARIEGIEPNESRRVTVSIDLDMLCCWDPKAAWRVHENGTKDKWIKPAGARTVYVDASSRDIRLIGTLNVEE